MKLYDRFQSYFARHIVWHFCEFLMYLPLALHCWHVWCYVHRNIQHLFTRQMFSVRAVQWYNLRYVTTLNASFYVRWLKFTCICHFLKQLTMHRPMSYFLQKYSMLHVCLCSEHMLHCRRFPLEGQCCACFNSSRLSWDAVGLGLPLEMPLTVTFSSCKWIINLRTRISWKFFCIIVEEAITCQYIWIKWSAVLLLSGPIIFEAVMLVMPHLNCKSKKCVLYLIILFNLIVPTLLSLVGGPLLGNGCGSPNHI
jgi:hypothetical protein